MRERYGKVCHVYESETLEMKKIVFALLLIIPSLAIARPPTPGSLRAIPPNSRVIYSTPNRQSGYDFYSSEGSEGRTTMDRKGNISDFNSRGEIISRSSKSSNGSYTTFRYGVGYTHSNSTNFKSTPKGK